MGKDHHGCLGSVSNSGGIGSGFLTVTSSVHKSNSYVSDFRQGEVSSSVGGSTYSPSEGSDRGTFSSSAHSGFLLSSVLGSQENRWNETGNRPVYSEHFSFGSTFQNGNQQVHPSFCPSRYVDYQPGSFGRLFPYPYFKGVQEIPSLCLGWQSVPISCSPFWVGSSSTGLYQSFSDSYCTSAYPVHTSSFLSGRFPLEGIQSRDSFRAHPPCDQTFSRSRFPHFLEEVRAHPFSEFPVSGGTLQDRLGSDFSARREISVSLSENSVLSGQPYCNGSPVFSVTGISELSSRCNSPRSASYPSSSVLSSGTLGTSLTRLGGNSSSSSCFTSSSSLVDAQGQCHDRGPLITTCPYSDSLHGCFPSGLGSVSRREVSFGGVVSCSTARTHQYSGNEGSLVSSSVLQDSSCLSNSSSGNRQYHCSSLSEESGRHSLLFSVCPLQGDSTSVSSVPHSSGSQTYSGNLQCSSRFSVPFSYSSEHRVGIVTSSIQLHHSSLGSASCGSVCYQSQSQTGDLCLTSSRPSGIRSRRHVSVLGRNVRLCLSSLQTSSQSSSKDLSRKMQDHTYCSSLAKASMVPRSSSSIVCQTPSTTSETRSVISVQRESRTSKSRNSASSRMVTIREGLRQKGFSEGATSHISKSVRQSTGIVYDAKWSIFCDWCLGKEINPIQVSVQQLADFLLYLFEDKHLSPSTIKGYRSAISRTISILGGQDFGGNEHISLLLRNFSLERPKQTRLVPQWDLGLVLSALNSAPFEPAEEVDLRFLAYKCCFLLALASGRRRSEIHALSVSESCLRFSRNKSSVTLLTDPSFLGKNQISDKGAEPIFIPALPDEVPSKLLCPIRSLSIYLDRTKNSRPVNNTRLFLPLKKGISDLSAKSISSWICRTIQLAYESSGEELLARHSVKAHEVRALASSWALFNSASISDVLAAGYWRCQNSFTSFYLRSMSAQADSLFSLGPIVAAQQINFPPVSSKSGDSAFC